MAIRHESGWYKKLASGKVDHIRNQVNNIGYMDNHIIYSQLQPVDLPVVRQKEGFAEIPTKISKHTVFLRGGSLKGNIALKD